MQTFLELPKQAGPPSWLDGRHPLFLTEDGKLVDEDGELQNREITAQIVTFVPESREQFHGRVAKSG